MRIVSWNIRAGGGNRVDAIQAQLERWTPDIVGLCEFRGTPPRLRLAESLRELGFEHQLNTIAPAAPRRNSLLIASKLPLRLHRLRRAPLEPGRWLLASVSDETPFLLGIMHLPNTVTGRKLTYMASIATLTTRWRHGPAVFLGDTNCGWPVLDEQTRVFGKETAKWLDGLHARGWRDAFRHFSPEERSYTWCSPNGGNGFRLDQAFVNRAMLSRLVSLRYEWGRAEGLEEPARREALSDHAALVLDLR